ncbi:hypothetical protein [Alteromonas ponticola]|uniref:Uncharacterized protein n=1 Tax=Alteromonas ponticola TaxID=2720613 RepID=A0ABX1R1E7_9ALTE|nr:hypothetical protein [Alteromonas ponticola]NMH59741.1 hypothetical protein [Alteromonas ponticola]
MQNTEKGWAAPSIMQHDESIQELTRYESASGLNCVIAMTKGNNEKSHFCWKNDRWVELKALN